MVTKEDFPNCCHYCEFRHSGCCSEEEILKSFDTNECNYFIPGKCYYCAVHQGAVDDDEKRLVCSEAFYPDGCENFKEGTDYGIYLKYIKEHNGPRSSRTIINRGPDRASRRQATIKHHRRLKIIANNCHWYPGPYMDSTRGRVINPGRGRISKYLKKRSNKRVRQYKKSLPHNGSYKKLYDYWWYIS